MLFKLGDDYMIKQIAWNTFKNTGDINTFLELIEVENVENDMMKAEQYGDIQYKRDNNSREQYERL